MKSVTLKWVGSDGLDRYCHVDLRDEAVEVGDIVIQPRGLGDTVKKVINKVTRGKIKPCGGCKKRQDALNKLVPYGDKDGN